jgi:hypothetical protein
MSSISLNCPSGGNVVVHTQGSGSGVTQTICACGGYFDPPTERPTWLEPLIVLVKAMVSWIRKLLGQPAAKVIATGPVVWVRVVNAGGGDQPNPPQPGDQSAIPNGQSWCASGVPVPASTASGAALTCYAWLAPGDGSIDPPQVADFNCGGSGAVDCCVSCGSDSGSRTIVLPRELLTHQSLEISIPDGPYTGHYKAVVISHLTWGLTISEIPYRIAADTSNLLVLHAPASSAVSTSVEREPFSASFPGVLFGSAGDVVVTIA